MKFVKFLSKRPSDVTIRVGRVLFGSTIIALLAMNLDTIHLVLPAQAAAFEIQIKYGLFVFPIVPILMGIVPICLMRKKYMKRLQMSFGLMLILGGSYLIADPIMPEPVTSTPTTVATASGSSGLDYASLTKVPEMPAAPKAPLNVGFWIALLGILPLFAGITGKCILSGCLKYGEKITKIRV